MVNNSPAVSKIGTFSLLKHDKVFHVLAQTALRSLPPLSPAQSDETQSDETEFNIVKQCLGGIFKFTCDDKLLKSGELY